jgi:hypothetical protein
LIRAEDVDHRIFQRCVGCSSPDAASLKRKRAGEDTMADNRSTPARARWARFRFGVIAPLLTAPPEPGELSASIAALAARSWPHPTTGEAIRFSAKTIERWFYIARDDEKPIEALARKVPSHAGTHPSISRAVEDEMRIPAHPISRSGGIRSSFRRCDQGSERSDE